MPRSSTAIRVVAPLVLVFALLLAVFAIVPARAETPVQISISPTAVCALTDTGEIGCWGFDIALVRDVPEGVFTDLSVGPTDACAISADGAAVCWGDGYANVRARIDSMLERDPDVDLSLSGLDQYVPPDRTDLVQVAVHPWRHYACGHTTAGEIACWGPPLRDKPAPLGAGFVDLISTGREFCALDSEGRTTCWGDMTFDQFVSDAGPFSRIAASGNGLCGVTAEGDVRCRTHDSRTAPGSPQPYNQIFRNVHVIGAQGCGIVDDGSLQCRQTHHWCHHLIGPGAEYCPPELIRFQAWNIPFTRLYEGGPDRETTEARNYVRLFGDQAACAITTEGEIDCWSDFRSGDPRHDVPERFRPLPPDEEPEAPAEEDEPDVSDPPSTP